jgi:hypothetical protein
MNAVSLLSRVAQQGAGTVVDCPVFGIGMRSLACAFFRK